MSEKSESPIAAAVDAAAIDNAEKPVAAESRKWVTGPAALQYWEQSE